EVVDFHTVSGCGHEYVAAEPPAMGDSDVDFPILDREGDGGLALVDRDLVRDSVPQPVRRPGAGVPSQRAVLPGPGEAVEEERDMLEDPVLPSRTDPGVGRPDLLEHAPLAHAGPLEPDDRTSGNEVHGCPDLVQEGRVVDGALASADHDDAFASKRLEVAELARMYYESRWQAAEFVRPVGVVPDPNCHDDRGTLDPTPV